MSAFLAVTTPVLMVLARAMELRLEHYKEKPELRKLDAENALLFGQWGQMVLKLLLRMFRELDLDAEPVPQPPPES